MGDVNVQEENFPEIWTSVASELNISQLDNLDSDGVNIQCVNSSEFVVGKQTNFNGPVTIINCPNEKALDGGEKPKEEKIVIRDKVLSQTAAVTMEKMATGKKAESVDGKKSKRIKVWMTVLSIGVVFLISAAVSLTLLLQEEEVPRVQGSLLLSLFSFGLGAIICIAFRSADLEGNYTQPLKRPASYVVIAQTFDEFCHDLKECLAALRSWFKKDAPCNFLLGCDGNAYEDLGWEKEAPLGGPAEGDSIQICFMGDYPGWDIPTYPQVEAAKMLIEFAIEEGYLSKDYTILPSNATERGDLGSIYNIETLGNSTYRMYSKTDWGGRPATSFILMKLPVPYAVVSHTATFPCSTLDTCSPLLKNCQSYHQSMAYADIAYNFLIDSSGNIYEGRGWMRRNANGGFVNGRNTDVCLIGDFSQDSVPKEDQMDALKYLLEYGVKTGHLSPEYSLLSANSTFATLSPGKHVYEIIKNWPHFDPDPISHVKDFEE